MAIQQSQKEDSRVDMGQKLLCTNTYPIKVYPSNDDLKAYKQDRFNANYTNDKEKFNKKGKQKILTRLVQ